jgi:hypothetical protein
MKAPLGGRGARALSARLILRVTALGFASWGIPFAASFLFAGKDGRILVPDELFKSIMVVLSGGAGAALLLAVLRKVEPTMASGLLVGCWWLIINLGLDLLILVPMTHMSVADYVMGIGVRYLLIPILAVCIALAANADG